MASVGVDYGYYLYTCDDGVTEYNIRIQKTIGDNADAGFQAYDASKPVMPLSNPHIFRARYALLISATTGNRRRIPIGTTTCDLWTGAENEVSFPIRGTATPEVFQITHLGAEQRAIAHDVFNL